VARWLLVIVLFGAAGLVPAAPLSSSTFALPPTTEAATLLALGRTRAAGMAGWLATVQLVGQDAYIRAKYPGLERWLSFVFSLEPDARNAYYLGTVLLLADRERSAEMDRLLALAEDRNPGEWEFSMMRGSGAYFGRLDAATAAKHYANAASKPNAPAYLGLLAKRLERHVVDCPSLMTDLKAVASANDPGNMLTQQRSSVFRECVRRQLEQAAAGYRMNNERAPTIDDLVEKGYLAAPPPHPRGECWHFAGPRAVLEPCSEK
jgi:hypothetical protein